MLVFLRWTPVPSLRSRTSDRKALLFACACCVEIEEAITDERSKKALSTARRFADGMATIRELDAAREAAWEAAHDLRGLPMPTDRCRRNAAIAAAYAAAHPASRYARDVAGNAAYAIPSAAVDAALLARANARSHEVASAHEKAMEALRGLADSAKRGQVLLLRDIIGNPFRPLAIDPAWLTPAVVSMAREVYDEPAFGSPEILAESLSDIGCVDESILGHCRSPGPHVRGCWVVDAILGKT